MLQVNIQGFVLGFFSYILCRLFVFILRIRRPEKLKNLESLKNYKLSDHLKQNINIALQKTNEVAWINVVANRMFILLMSNYAFKNRIKNAIMKSFVSVLKIGIIRNAKIKSMDFGANAPCIRNIKLVDPERARTAAKNRAASPEKSKDCIILFENVDGRVRSTEECEHADAEDIYKMAEDSDARYRKIFAELTFQAEMEYAGTSVIELAIELFSGMRLVTKIQVNRMSGDILVRVPAHDYSTRYECSFQGTPEYEILVDTRHNSSLAVSYFDRAVNGIVKTLIRRTIRNVAVLPNWMQFYLGGITTLREMHHTPSLIKKGDRHCKDIANNILIDISSDFKIVGRRSGIIHRMCAFQHENEDRAIKMHQFFVECEEPGKIRFYFENEKIFGLLYEKCTEASVIEKWKKCATVSLKIKEDVFSFVRILHDDYVIYVLNDGASPDFIVFHLQGDTVSTGNSQQASSNSTTTVSINSYITHKSLALSHRKIKRLKRELEGHLTSIAPAELSAGPSKIDLFRDILENRFLCLEVEKFVLRVPKNEVLAYLRSGETRVLLFERGGAVYDICGSSRKTAQDVFLINSYVCDRFLMDVCPERRETVVYYPEESLGCTSISIFYEKSMGILFPNKLVEKLLYFGYRYLIGEMVRNIPYLSSDGVVHEEFRTFAGCVYIEIGEIPNCLCKLKIKSCKNQKTLLHVDRVVLNAPFAVMVPVDNDYVSVRMHLKTRNADGVLRYKISVVKMQRDLLVEGQVLLRGRRELKVPFVGHHTQMVYWERAGSSRVKVWIKDEDGRHPLDDRGILRTESKRYALVYSNRRRSAEVVRIAVGLMCKETLQ